MRLTLLGPPASGKSSISRMISNIYGTHVISLSEIVRNEINKGSQLGRFAKYYMDNGILLPDETVAEIISAQLKAIKDNYLLDGFPRTMNQVNILDEILKKDNSRLDLAIYIHVDDEIIIQRAAKRIVCPKCGHLYSSDDFTDNEEFICKKCNAFLQRRADDQMSIFRNRLALYKQSICPILQFYKQSGILRVLDNNKTVNEKEVYGFIN